MSADPNRDEAERICRVADMMCTGHAMRRDYFASLARLLDISILATSTWMVALTFAEQAIQELLTPLDIKPNIWIGLMGVLTFFASLVQLCVNWKERASGHQHSLRGYAEMKSEAQSILRESVISPETVKRLIDRYAFVGKEALSIPEAFFLTMKSAHKKKVAISNYLDSKPSASIFLTRIRLWFKDNT